MDMKICVQTQIGTARPYSFNVNSTATVKELKQLVRQKTGDNEDTLKDMYFTFDMDILDEDEQTLQSFGVETDSVLVLCYSNVRSRNIGVLGARFADVSNAASVQRLEWSKTAPHWRRTRCGLCLEGICINEQCKAFNQQVIMPVGYRKFDILLDLDDVTTVCPICKSFVQPITCGFNNCWWRFQGIKKAENDARAAPKKCSSEWKQADNAYHCFEQSVSGTVTWNQLIIEATKNKPQS
ncbi:unnamed protein product [Rotaria magnacalcarata]|uniref:Ubiquitin-like domain-containing protein n=1 Tax=Rotaria magnacalcarata TaxID=392030 RepID=A0A816T1N7_9BILA|nr:unnamed protein product [Rotaria magnacalcarata]CAF4034799.1 unnamed protein product [Rotaria magnacalcarata]